MKPPGVLIHLEIFISHEWLPAKHSSTSRNNIVISNDVVF